MALTAFRRGWWDDPVRIVSCALDFTELQQSLRGLPTTDGRIGFFVSHLSAYAFVLANISTIYIWYVGCDHCRVALLCSILCGLVYAGGVCKGALLTGAVTSVSVCVCVCVAGWVGR